MHDYIVLLSIPGLRERDVTVMRNLRTVMMGGEIADLTPSFPCVTCPVQAAMTTGKPASGHGVVANGFYWRDQQQVEMWTSPNNCIAGPQLWEVLAGAAPKRSSAVWFPLHSKQCTADYVCTPAPIHNPDGSESLWCYTRPEALYGTLRDELGHFPLQHFWGPMANAKSSQWIADSAACAARQWQPNFLYIYLPHLDYAAQRTGPDSVAAEQAVAELDELIGSLYQQLCAAYDTTPLLLIAGEYTITPVDHVTYPNRRLREAGLLAVSESDDGEHLDFEHSAAWAMVDHQFSHVFVRNGDVETTGKVADLFRGTPGIAEVLVGPELVKYDLAHQRSGEVVLVSTPDSWQAYYWWLDDSQSPGFARKVDIHRKPGYDPVELHIDPASKSIPLDATLIKGSHGAPVTDGTQRTVMLASEPGLLPHHTGMRDVDVFDVVLRQFGVEVE